MVSWFLEALSAKSTFLAADRDLRLSRRLSQYLLGPFHFQNK
jgi:hypothetical protein